MNAPAPLLEIENLRTWFATRDGVVKAVDGVSLHADDGEVVGLVGESGCGKSTLARTVVQLVPATAGAIRFEGQTLNELSREALRRLRPRIQMIFQDPYASLNPRQTVYDTLAEPMLAHGIVARRAAADEVARLMDAVGLARRFVRKYPHEFSGGQRQRIAIARALALRPKLVLADEPVSALDVSVQAQILNLLKHLSTEFGLAMLLIAHDLAVVKHVSRRIAVMYLGAIMEEGPAADVLLHPLHPYTRALISAIPTPDPVLARARKPILLQGDPPSPLRPPSGCRFHPRCPWATKACAQHAPELVEHRPNRKAACLRIDELPPA
jgi:oligopeptide transport system ATP-binding protein